MLRPVAKVAAVVVATVGLLSAMTSSIIIDGDDVGRSEISDRGVYSHPVADGAAAAERKEGIDLKAASFNESRPMTLDDVTADLAVVAGDSQPDSECVGDRSSSAARESMLYVVSRSTSYKLNVADHVERLREIHVKHDVQVCGEE
jgi:hypothetical protein